MSKRENRGVYEHPPGSGIWRIDYYDAEGRRHRERIGKKSTAIDVYHQRKAAISEGRFVTAKRVPASTFRQIAEARMSERKPHLAPLTWYSDNVRLQFILKEFSSAPAASLSPERFTNYLNGLVAGGLSTSTGNRYRSLIAAIYSHGMRAGKVKSNPIALVLPFKPREGRIRFLDAAEESAIRKVTRELHPDREAELDVALHTGIRKSEQFALRWEHVDLERKILTVGTEVRAKKTGRRFIPLNSVAIAAFEKLYKISNGSLYVCPDRKRDEQTDWRVWFQDVVERAKIDNFRWHDLRHTFASRLVMAGVPLSSVQKLLGHRSITTTERYSHLAPDFQRSSVERLVTPTDTPAESKIKKFGSR